MAVVDKVTGIRTAVGFKSPVRLASPLNVVPFGLLVIDGVQTAAGDRVALVSQAVGSQNGIYTASAGTWVRAFDFDSSDDVQLGTQFMVTTGATYARKILNLIGPVASTIRIGVDALVFATITYQSVATAILSILANGSIDFGAGDVTIQHAVDTLTFLGAANGYSFDKHVLPVANDGARLGTNAKGFSDLFLAAGGIIDFNNNQAQLYQGVGNRLEVTGILNAADLRVLDNPLQEKGSWTPDLTFGGAKVGRTGTLQGSYVRIGDLILAQYYILLTSKGSSVGNAAIAGLPYAGTYIGGDIPKDYQNFVGLAGPVLLSIQPGTSTALVRNTNTTAAVQITDANFSNNTYLQGTLVYRK